MNSHCSHILISDPDKRIRRYCQQVLEKAGYQVKTVPPDLQVLQQLRGQQDFDLILLDVDMGSKTSRTLMQRVPGLFPKAVMLYMSASFYGYPGFRTHTQHTIPALWKPFGPAELINKVRQTFSTVS